MERWKGLTRDTLLDRVISRLGRYCDVSGRGNHGRGESIKRLPARSRWVYKSRYKYPALYPARHESTRSFNRGYALLKRATNETKPLRKKKKEDGYEFAEIYEIGYILHTASIHIILRGYTFYDVKFVCLFPLTEKLNYLTNLVTICIEHKKSSFIHLLTQIYTVTIQKWKKNDFYCK